MKPLQLFVVLLTLFACLAGLAWLSRKLSTPKTTSTVQGPDSVQTPPTTPDPNEDHYDENPFELSTEGEQPHAELVEKQYEFGRMGLGRTGKHDFVIRNTGKVPLKIARGPTQCKCTVTGLKDREIPPGEEAKIHLEWTPKSVGPFAQTATIWTNDPENPKLVIGASGTMFEEIALQPHDGWVLGNLTSSDPTPFQGALQSPVFEEFEVTSIETSSDKVKVEAIPMTEEELKEQDLRSGYKLQGELAGISEPGKVSESVTIHTNLPDYPKFELPLTATRVGAITIIGPNWYAGGPRLELKKVSADKGKEFKLTVMIPPFEDELKFVNVTSNPGFIQARLKPEKVGKDLPRERYSMYVTVPPGSPKGVWGPGNPGKLVISTNHPQVQDMEIEVYVDVE